MTSNIADTAKKYLMPAAVHVDTMMQYGSNYGVQSAIVSWLGHSVAKVSLLHGFGFGGVAGAVVAEVSRYVYNAIRNKDLDRELTNINNKFIRNEISPEKTMEEKAKIHSQKALEGKKSLALSIVLGGAAGYVASLGAAAVGFTAAPITLGGAVLCTTALVVINVSYTYFIDL